MSKVSVSVSFFRYALCALLAVGFLCLLSASAREARALAIPILLATETLDPDATGSPNAWIATGGNDYTVTSDSDDNTYIDTGTDEAEHMLNVTSPTFNSGYTINSVTVHVRGQSTGGGGGPERFVIQLESGTTTGESSDLTFDRSTPTEHTQQWTQDPDTSAAWTFSALASIEAGVRLTSIGGGETGRVHTASRQGLSEG